MQLGHQSVASGINAHETMYRELTERTARQPNNDDVEIDRESLTGHSVR